MARRHVSRSFATSRRNPRISMDEVRELAENQPTPLSLQQMKLFAAAGDKLRLVSASFLHKELQIRFARAIMELSDLPIGLSKTASVQKAIGVYCNELLLLKGMDPPSTSEEDMAFTDAIKKAKGRGMNLVPLICGGLQEIKATDLGSNALRLESVQEDIMHRLDTFFLSRIGIRMLIGQHVESLEQAGGRVELVNVEATVRSACQRAAKLCKKYKGQAPEVEIRLAANASAPFIYVESHLHHMVFEIVKNSMRATVEYHEGLQQKKPGRLNRLEHVMNPLSKHLGFVLPAVQEVQGVTIYPDVRNYRRPGELPPIQIVISQGQEELTGVSSKSVLQLADLTIKVSDEGGGVPRSKWPKIWHYDYTTSPPHPSRDSYGFHSFRQQFSGGGYGLPIARLFARYFGGEVTFISLEGSGSTAFIQAHRLGTKAEVVPGHATFSLQPLYS